MSSAEAEGETPAVDAERFARRAAHILGRDLAGWRPVSGGYTSAARLLAHFDGGTSAFVKAAPDEQVAGWLRTERSIYEALPADVRPEMLAWDDDGARPLLVLEDLSAAHWPPPWPDGSTGRVLTTLARVAATPPPPGLPRLEGMRLELAGWPAVADDPAPFLSLGLCSAGWLERALPRLLAAEAMAPLDGDDLLHLDVRSDNVCLTGQRALLVDWNWACVGNRLVDIAFWLPSLHAEGGPAPEAVLPDAPELAAAVSGYFAARAGLPPFARGARVREVQRFQLTTALPWAVRALGLEPRSP